jgi:hypothetical protein
MPSRWSELRPTKERSSNRNWEPPWLPKNAPHLPPPTSHRPPRPLPGGANSGHRESPKATKGQQGQIASRQHIAGEEQPEHSPISFRMRSADSRAHSFQTDSAPIKNNPIATFGRSDPASNKFQNVSTLERRPLRMPGHHHWDANRLA